MKILVTGGSGFIGSAVVRHLISEKGVAVLNLDCLSYAAVPGAVACVEDSPRYAMVKADICNREAVRLAFEQHQPDKVMHLAAESHVDRSIDGPEAFVQTNIVGTSILLQEATRYFSGLTGTRRERFRFHHISTDEVFGSLGPTGRFSEESPYDPRSPYAASKASADHLVRAWHHTYGLPVVISNCSNNFGPWQYPEKLMPVVIMKALSA
ncbi:MAG: dTDP-glucose 4,6-dehydratase, partial [Algiphilus sp.]